MVRLFTRQVAHYSLFLILCKSSDRSQRAGIFKQAKYLNNYSPLGEYSLRSKLHMCSHAFKRMWHVKRPIHAVYHMWHHVWAINSGNWAVLASFNSRHWPLQKFLLLNCTVSSVNCSLRSVLIKCRARSYVTHPLLFQNEQEKYTLPSFIEGYKNLPELWDQQCPTYSSNNIVQLFIQFCTQANCTVRLSL